ncbi:MAG TPA: hypothetical protein VMN38_07730 [Sphingomicrobium sp.]|nr:hypothetical protein [Sphingomicrobium sp.]
MKSILALCLSIGLAADHAAPASEHRTLMTFIENKVRLPDGARPIEEYSRNYARRPDGMIIGIYVTPHQPVAVDEGCEVMLEDFESRPCSDAEVAELVQQDLDMAATYGKAGQSRWFDDYRDLPFISDGGCAQVEITFDPRSNEIERADCNGVA